MKLIGAASIILLLSLPAFAEEKPVKRSMGDKCRYFEVSRVKNGDVVTMITHQNCPTWGDSFTKRKYHCKLRKIKFIAESSKIEKLNTYKGKPDKNWIDLVNGSSAYDTLIHACKKSK